MFIAILKFIRKKMVRFMFPKGSYFLLPTNKLKPISTKYGFDRGLPLDRYYIEKFLTENSSYIHGTCLEITDNAYTKKFGRAAVTRSDILDINTSNKKATIYGDLRDVPHIPDNAYDCIILTQTLGVIDDYFRAIQECHRILKPEGTVLATVTAIGPAWDPPHNYWRFTPAGLAFAFKKYFNEENIKAASYGNVLSGQAFWVGLAADELTKEELDYQDKHFPVIVVLTAVK